MTCGDRFQHRSMVVDGKDSFGPIIGKFSFNFDPLSVDPDVQSIFLENDTKILAIQMHRPRSTDFRSILTKFFQWLSIHFQRIFVSKTTDGIDIDRAEMFVDFEYFFSD